MLNNRFPLKTLLTVGLLLFTASVFVFVGESSADSAGGPELTGPVAEGDSVYLVPTIANDIVHNPADGKIYMSIPGIAGSNGNSIQTIDPTNGSLGQPVFAGSEPTKLALSDTGYALYVSLDATATIKRFITSTMTSDLEYSIGSDTSGPYRPSDMAVPPGYWNILAVIRGRGSYVDGVAIYNNSIRAPQTTNPNLDETDSLAFSDSASVLYGGSTSFYAGLTKIRVDANGATTLQTSTVGSGSKIKFSQGKIFTSRGQVINPDTNTVLGQFDPSLNTTAFVPDSNGRAYYLVRESSPSNTFSIRAYDINNFSLIGTMTISGVTADPAKMIRWGANGLAVRTITGQVFVIQTTLIPTPQPVPTPSTIPTPTPTPTPIERQVEQINITANGIDYNPSNNRLYVSVPSNSPANGNTVTVVDPSNASIQSSVFIGSEPSQIKLARDGSRAYVYLAGAKELRLFDVASNTPGQQFPVGDIWDIDTAPGSPNVIAVSLQGSGVAIYDGTVRRPQLGGGGTNVAFTDSGSTIYSGGNFYSISRLTVNALGIGSSTSLGYVSGSYMAFQNGTVYGSNGGVLDTNAVAIKGAFPISAAGTDPRLVVVPEYNRILYLGQNSRRIYAYELDTFRPIGSIAVPGNGTFSGFKRIDTNGVAISQTNGPLLIVRSALVNPNLPVPTQTPTPTPTPTPSPTPDSPFVRRINHPNNDMVFNAADGKFYISVPGELKDGTGNTITRIDPNTGQFVSSTFIGSEPTKLALSENNQVLFTNLAGAGHAIRTFDSVNLTAGLQYPLTHVPNGYNPIVRDMAAVPGSPNSIVISAGSFGAAVYDSGVKRANTAQASFLEFSSQPNLLYAWADDGISRLALNSEGLTRINGLGGLIGPDLTFFEGKLFSATGRIVDPEMNRTVGTFQTPSSSYVLAVDGTQRKVFIAGSEGINIYNVDTFLKIGTIPVPGGVSSNVTKMVRWGENGLALRIGSTPSYIQLLQSRLVSPNGTVPTGISFNTNGQTFSEASFGITVAVTRTGDLSGTSTVNYATADGSAIAGQDYNATSGTVTFAPGESSKSFVVQLINDNVFENGSENFRVVLSPVAGETAQIVAPATNTITIFDNDPTPTILPVDAGATETRGGTNSTVNVRVNLSSRSVLPISVSYATAAGTASSGVDFVPASGVLTFQPLETTKLIPITLIGDDLPEGNETFRLIFSSPSNGNMFDFEAVVTIANLEVVDGTLFDYDGDGRADLSVQRPSDNTWYIQGSSAGYSLQTLGQAGDKLVPADYDGDELTDVAVFRPDSGSWLIFMSRTQTLSAFVWGVSGDLPVPSDRDGDGRSDLVLFRPSNNRWYTRYANGNFHEVTFGEAGDKPVIGDFDADHVSDVAVYRPSNHNWYIIGSSSGYFVQTWGEPGDIPITADFDGDGATDRAVFRPSTGQWYLSWSTAGFGVLNWGQIGDIPVPADYDGDDRADVAVFRPSNGTWYIINTTTGIVIQQFGQTGDVPTQSSFSF